MLASRRSSAGSRVRHRRGWVQGQRRRPGSPLVGRQVRPGRGGPDRHRDRGRRRRDPRQVRSGARIGNVVDDEVRGDASMDPSGTGSRGAPACRTRAPPPPMPRPPCQGHMSASGSTARTVGPPSAAIASSRSRTRRDGRAPGRWRPAGRNCSDAEGREGSAVRVGHSVEAAHAPSSGISTVASVSVASRCRAPPGTGRGARRAPAGYRPDPRRQHQRSAPEAEQVRRSGAPRSSRRSKSAASSPRKTRRTPAAGRRSSRRPHGRRAPSAPRARGCVRRPAHLRSSTRPAAGIQQGTDVPIEVAA